MTDRRQPEGKSKSLLEGKSTKSQPRQLPPLFFQKYCRTNGGRTAVQMGGVLQYKWEAYCHLWVSLSSKLRSQESTAIQMGGVLPYKLRCTAVLFRQVVGVGVSETLPNSCLKVSILEGLSGPLDRLNDILSLLQPLDRYRAPSALVAQIARCNRDVRCDSNRTPPNH